MKNLRFVISTFIPEKLQWLPAVISLHSIHVQKFAKNFLWLESNPQKMWNFFTVNNKQYTVYCTGINIVGFKVS